LAESEWVGGPEARLVRILLHGLRGPIRIQGVDYDLEMPGFGFYPDADVAALLTYVRLQWGDGARPVQPENVEAVRAATANRGVPWTTAELRELQ
jgi:mono/diheme cytochrome c family protein